MRYCQYVTKNFKHEYFFTFKDENYLVHSIVRLSKKGKKYLDTTKDQAILTEHFINYDGKECWTYVVGWAHGANKPLRISIDQHPNNVIEEVIIPASANYMQRELFGTKATSYTEGTKHTHKDWEITEVRNAWIYLILIFIGAAIFKDWYVRLIIRGAAAWFFGIYRQAYVGAYTTYTHEEDNEITKKKYEILYGAKFDKEDK